MEKKLFYRVANTDMNNGLWYNMDGTFTGRIHEEFSFCSASKLPMPYDENVLGYLSVVDKLEDLYNWFSLEDIIRLRPFGFAIIVYEATDYREYHNHWVIHKDSKVVHTM